VALLVGFYLLAIGVIIGLVAIPYAEWRLAHRVDLRILIGCLGAAFVVLLSIIPRADKFIPPGPLLNESQHPALFTAIREIAGKTEQAMPVEVYLDADLNAYVAQRGGVMGFGSRRIMGLGLPLLQLLSISELKAVLAHEFGHYHGGDTALGPWIYKTRAAIVRTVQNLAASESMLTRVFDWYGKTFMRITQAISRRQEFAADALAASTVGATPMVAGLRVIHGGAKTFYSFFDAEVAPVLDRGYAPPYSSGFKRMMELPEVKAGVAAAVEAEVREGKVNPFDSHPPLNERLSALQLLPSGDANDPTPAITLLNNAGALEVELLQYIARHSGKKLEPITWDESAEKVWVAQWTDLIRSNKARLQGVTPAKLGTVATDMNQLAITLQFAPSADLVMQQHREAAFNVAGAALGLALRARGWQISAAPGEPISLALNGRRCSTFEMLAHLSNGKYSTEEWVSFMKEQGIAEVDLAVV
jgi:Zn-dependent protease with chaperone function